MKKLDLSLPTVRTKLSWCNANEVLLRDGSPDGGQILVAYNGRWPCPDRCHLPPRRDAAAGIAGWGQAGWRGQRERVRTRAAVQNSDFFRLKI